MKDVILKFLFCPKMRGKKYFLKHILYSKRWVNNRIVIFGRTIPFTLFDYYTNSSTSPVPLGEWSP